MILASLNYFNWCRREKGSHRYRWTKDRGDVNSRFGWEHEKGIQINLFTKCRYFQFISFYVKES